MTIKGFPRTNNNPNPSNGTGFIYGGGFDARSEATSNIAVFDALTSCTIVDNVFTPVGYATACATYIQPDQANLPKAEIRFIWPATDGSTVLVFGLFAPASFGTLDDMSASPITRCFALSYFSGMLMETLKVDENTPSGVPIGEVTMVEGDSILVTLEYDTNILTFLNETQNIILISQDVGAFSAFAESRSIFIYGNTPIAFDIAGTVFPASQTVYSVPIPSNPDGKTYRVTDVDANSIVYGNRLLKVDDFVTFFASGTDCVVTRLLSDSDLQTMIQTYVIDSLYLELSSNPTSNLATEIKNLAVVAVSEELTPPETSTFSITEGVTYLADAAITSALNPESNGVIVTSIQEHITEACTAESANPEVITAINTVIGNEVQTGGVIDNAIQAAINP